MSSQYDELRPTNGWDRLVSLGHPNKFQLVSRISFVTGPTSFNGGQPNFAQCLAVSCAGTVCKRFWGLLPHNGIFPGAKFTFCPSFAFSYIGSAAALLHGTRAAGVSQTLRRGTRNGITELSQTAPPILGRAAITLGIGPHSSCVYSVVYFRQHEESSIRCAKTATCWIWNNEDCSRFNEILL